MRAFLTPKIPRHMLGAVQPSRIVVADGSVRRWALHSPRCRSLGALGECEECSAIPCSWAGPDQPVTVRAVADAPEHIADPEHLQPYDVRAAIVVSVGLAEAFAEPVLLRAPLLPSHQPAAPKLSPAEMAERAATMLASLGERPRF